ncbi:alanyl-tRNA editing protein [Psychrobacillus sp. INOP01]|uniref:alanyl-tRNA editing protein n=1 Tax=Psychrobacillus sp. INOP01 TaxID=2829187 RepID=UPI001BABEAE5|nr:DHHA1 domain-containing protein [Psychrobacillus sp. INOP01]QUG43580.1 alanyl-tRNA editing protein [Psychrobacillus sp. INOP01]
MTNKLYYEDPCIQSFKAKVIEQQVDYVVLSETAFYPTGGGQPHDLGLLNGIEVTNVEVINGEIRHFLTNPLPENTTEVNGQINWERRFDHMQQHAGQHILSAAFEQLFGFQTISFHLGKDTVTIDLNVTEVSERQLTEAEQLANQIILEDRLIETKWVTEEELSNYNLRKATSLKENIRLVIIPDFDYNACGGTHPTSTGQVRAIKILHTERQKKIVRVEFICGERILTHLHRKHDVLVNLVSTLSTPEDKIMNATKNLLEQNSRLEKQVADLSNSLLAYEAKELRESAKGTTITCILEKRSMQELQKLAKLVVNETPKSICIFVSNNQEKLQIVASKGSDVEQSMKELIAHVLPYINGKGGGNERMAQGGGDKIITSEQLMEKAISYI